MDAETKLKALVKAGAKPKQWLAEMAKYGISRATAYRMKDRLEKKAPKKLPKQEKAHPTPTRYIEVPEPEPERVMDAVQADHSAMLGEISNDMREIRRANRREHPKLAIDAAVAEANLIMAAAKLAKELRQAAHDDITLHPQHARFRQDIIQAIQGTDAEAAVIALFEGRQMLVVQHEE